MKPDWIKKAQLLPLGFAQVREDALIDIDLVSKIPPNARVILVASGGCTGAALSKAGISYLHLVDPNPAQIALSRLKLQLLKTADLEERLALLGHIRMDKDHRKVQLVNRFSKLNLHENILGPIDFVSTIGPDFSGRYELVFAKFREALQEHTEGLQALFDLRDTVEQRKRVDASTILGKAIDKAFEQIVSLSNLEELFGITATANRIQNFSHHFAWRTRQTLATILAHSNPYLAQILLGHFCNGIYSPWLTLTASNLLPETKFSTMEMTEALKREKPSSLDFVHLSNILDWTSTSKASELLQLSWRALREGGFVLIRQLNSALDIPALGKAFTWDAPRSQSWLEQDRSFFYRALHFGQKI